MYRFYLGVIFIAASETAIAAYSEQSFYCPQGQKTVQVGMTDKEVLDACGNPNAKIAAKHAATERVPVTVLIYSSINAPNPYSDSGMGQVNAVYNNWYPGLDSIYQEFSLPKNRNDSFKMQVSIIKNKVAAISTNGSSSNKMTLCGNKFQIGDDVNQVYAACGTPDATNVNYIDQPIPSRTRPMTWIYQVDEFQPAYRLTFIDGRLESIDKEEQQKPID